MISEHETDHDGEPEDLEYLFDDDPDEEITSFDMPDAEADSLEDFAQQLVLTVKGSTATLDNNPAIPTLVDSDIMQDTEQALQQHDNRSNARCDSGRTLAEPPGTAVDTVMTSDIEENVQENTTSQLDVAQIYYQNTNSHGNHLITSGTLEQQANDLRAFFTPTQVNFQLAVLPVQEQSSTIHTQSSASEHSTPYQNHTLQYSNISLAYPGYELPGYAHPDSVYQSYTQPGPIAPYPPMARISQMYNALDPGHFQPIPFAAQDYNTNFAPVAESDMNREKYIPFQAPQQSIYERGQSRSPRIIISPRTNEKRPPRIDPTKPHVRINLKTKGMNNRSAKAEQLAARGERLYNEGETLVPWAGTFWSTPSGESFRYQPSGELLDSVMSKDSVASFLWNHPIFYAEPNGQDPDNTERGKMVLWIQKVPADSARRYKTASMSLCRFQHCPIHKRTIKAGHYRVVFDERWSIYGNRADPFNFAGCVHLYCLERFLNLPMLCTLPNIVVKVDDRKFESEENKMESLPQLRDVFNKFIRNCQAAKNTYGDLRAQLHQRGAFEGYPVFDNDKEQPNFSAVYDKTLNYIAQRHMNLSRKKTALETFKEHMGDLAKFQQREDAKRQMARDAKHQIGERRSPRNHAGSPRVAGFQDLPEAMRESDVKRNPKFAPTESSDVQDLTDDPEQQRRVLRNTHLNSRSHMDQYSYNEVPADVDTENIIESTEDVDGGLRRSPRRSPTQSTQVSPNWLKGAQDSPRSILRTQDAPSRKRKAHIAWAKEDDIAPDLSSKLSNKKQYAGDMRNPKNWSTFKIAKAPVSRKWRASSVG